MKKTITIFILFSILLIAACKKDGKPVIKSIDTVTAIAVNTPQKKWLEHWYEHADLLTNVYYNDDLALYYDDAMDTAITWPRGAYTRIWHYIKQTYGSFGDSSRLYVVLHANKHEGSGHHSPYYDVSHDYRNVLDAGESLSDWYKESGDKLRLPIHEIGHIIASSSNGRTHDLQDDNIWGDSKFAEIFIYDVLLNSGYKSEADAVYAQMNDPSQTDNYSYPGVKFPGVNFFVDWFYPIYTKYGKGAVLARYFKQIADNVPMDRTDDLNLGEFVHFFSGAAGANLREQAKIAFKDYWTSEAEAQLKQAQLDYPGVKYPY